MITFNLQAAHNGNWFAGYEPGLGDPWTSNQSRALVFTIEQARELVAAWHGCGLRIEIAFTAEPIQDERFQRELFCAGGGDWYDYRGPLCFPVAVCSCCSVAAQECIAYRQFSGWTLCTHEHLIKICEWYQEKFRSMTCG